MIPDQQRSPESAVRSEREPLPPLPDGGLAGSLPDWLRDEPAAAQPTATAALDPASLVSADDLPDWLRQLSPEHRSLPEQAALPSSPPVVRAPAAPVAPVAVPSPPVTPPATPEPGPVVASRPAIVPAPAIVPTQAMAQSPAPASRGDMARRKAIVTVLGVVLLALMVVAIVYVRGGL